MIRQLVDFAHARTSVARQGMRVPFVGPVPKSAVHPDTAGSDVFERFEQLCVEAAEINAERAFLDALNKNPLRVTTQFDARVHRGTQRGKHGPKSYVDQSKPRKNGPLRTLFMAYASRDDHRGPPRDDRPARAKRRHPPATRTRARPRRRPWRPARDSQVGDARG